MCLTYTCQTHTLVLPLSLSLLPHFRTYFLLSLKSLILMPVLIFLSYVYIKCVSLQSNPLSSLSLSFSLYTPLDGLVGRYDTNRGRKLTLTSASTKRALASLVHAHATHGGWTV